ncbi:SspB-related isopeptide-forming adhesin [Streptococcus sp. E17BB]|uniref:SspB-related isopeptide-forming adhesin n=1 Tax=Streptococcus sp. E17BB TaxID=3278714 RepID=UPI00359D37A8
MTTNKNQQLFTVNEQEKFKFRKSKKFKNLCSVAIGILSISRLGLATAPVSADEAVTPAAAASTVVALNTTSEALPDATASNMEATVTPDTAVASPSDEVEEETGTIPITTSPSSVTEAVLTAQQEGIVVTEEAVKDFGTTTSVEETLEKKAEIEADYAKQVETISQVTEAYAKEKEEHKEATLAVINLNQNLKTEYDAKIVAYNNEVALVNAQNEDIDQAYEQARQAYEAEVVNIDAYNANAKSQYEEAFKRYQAEVLRITQQNEYKKQQYHTELSEFNKQVAIVNEDNQQLEADYQAAYKNYQAEVARINQSNSEAENAYNQALATYRSEVERINRENEAKRVAYDAARKTNETNAAATEAENQLIRQRNQKAQEAYDRAMAVYRTEKERHDRAVAEAQINTTREGYLSSVQGQQLVLPSEPNARATITSSTGLKYVTESGARELGITDREKFLFNNTSKYNDNNTSLDYNQAKRLFVDRGEYSSNYILLAAKEGDVFSVAYTGLQNSYVGTTKIEKIVYDYEVVSLSSSTQKVNLGIYDNPAVTIDLLTENDNKSKEVRVRIRPKYYDGNGNQIDLSQYDSVFGFASLSSDWHAGQKEGIHNAQGLEFIKITGSTISNNNGSWESDIDNNHWLSGGSKYEVGSDDLGQYAYYLAAAAKVTSKDISLDFVSRSYKEDTYDTKGYWMTLNSNVRASGGLIPAPPKEPTLKLEEEKTPTTIPVEVPNYEKLPEAPTVSYLSAPEAPTKPTPKPLPKEPTVPSYEGLPAAPTVTYKETPRAPQKDPSVPLPPKPEIPNYQELPQAPVAPRVSYHQASLTYKPSTKPTKTNTDVSGVVIDGQPVVAESVNYYKITLDYSPYKGIDVAPQLIAQGFFGLDDIPEEALIFENSGIKLETADKKAVKGMTTTVYSDLSKAPETVQKAMAKRGYTPKGLIAVLAAEDPKAFYETYVRTGMTLTATLPMTVKADMAKTGGEYANTAYQIDFGSAYVTETVVNNVIPVGRVLVNFLEEGTRQVLSNQVIDENDVLAGTVYDTTDRKLNEIVTKDGKTYELIRHEGQEQGKVVKGDTVIDYIYKEVKGNVLVNYKLEDGTVIKQPVIDTDDASTGTSYDTTDHKLIEIVTKDGKTYKLIRHEGQEQGKVAKGDTVIDYIYKEVKADVIVNYVDEEGNVIKQPVKDTEQASTGTSYDTTDHKLDYITVDGVRYKLMPKKTVGVETGTLTKDGASVTYVYHKIVTNWIKEEDKTPLKPQEDGEKDRGEFIGRTFVVTEIDPETGDITHVFKKIPEPIQTTPPAPPTQSPQPVAQLPKTGEVSSAALFVLGLGTTTVATGLAIQKRRKED